MAEQSPVEPKGEVAASQQAPAHLIALFDYMEHVEKLNRAAAFEVPRDHFRGFEGDLLGLPGVLLDQGGADEEVWLSVARLSQGAPPGLPPALEPWVTMTTSPDRAPTLKDEAVVDAADGLGPVLVALSQIPDVESQFRHYLSREWEPWALSERLRRRTIELYGRLYASQQALETEGAETPLEAIWGLGIAQWSNGGRRLEHPLISIPVALALNSKTHAIEVRPRDALPLLEMDAFAELECHGVRQAEANWKQFLDDTDDGINPFQPATFESVIRATAGLLHESGGYLPDHRDRSERRLPQVTERLTVSDTWVLFVRKRTANFLVEDLKRLKEDLKNRVDVPAGPASLVTKPNREQPVNRAQRFRGVSHSGGGLDTGESYIDLHFPKPYNEAQVAIVEKLEVSPGVVVQGPPGTGKTHTIANIICHYLALGRRVLVTSKGEPALAVLRDQIPEPIRPLTVALLSDESDGMRQFEYAIQKIASEVSTIQPGRLRSEIDSVTARLEVLHGKMMHVDREIDRWARNHMEPRSFQGREVLPEEIARSVVENADRYSWFIDVLSDLNVPPDLGENEFADLRAARLRLGSDLEYVGLTLPSAEALPDAASIGQLHSDLVEGARVTAEIRASGQPTLVDQSPTTIQAAGRICEALKSASAQWANLFSTAKSAATCYVEHVKGGQLSVLARLHEQVHEVLEADKRRLGLTKNPVSAPVGAELDDDLLKALDRGSQGMRPFPIFVLGKKESRGLLAEIKIGGLKPKSNADYAHVLETLQFLRVVRATLVRWNAIAPEFGLEGVDEQDVRSLTQAVRQGRAVAAARHLISETLPKLLNEVATILVGHVRIDPLRTSAIELSSISDGLNSLLTESRLATAGAKINALHGAIEPSEGRISQRVRDFVKNDLGRAACTQREISMTWSDLLVEVSRIQRLRPAMEVVERAAEGLIRAGAPLWAHRIRSEVAAGDTDPWTPSDWREAWAWRQYKDYLDRIDKRHELVALHRMRSELERDISRAYQDLIERKTWLAVHTNSPDSVKSALQAYLNAIMRIGKGTGIRAVRYRREARKSMVEAHRAVPCWIMPHWRVSETLPSEVGRFDLVIIDEASQSDLWALPSLVRGAKLLIVGDDKQVSPDGIGLAEEKVKELHARFLRQQVFGDQMTPEKSLYDLAKVVFAGQSVMLQEHFRCVAPIIEFSKREFYGHDIRPLRLPRASERLDPPLVDVYVKGGQRDRSKVNKAEAKAIVQEIENILEDPACVGRTIGVVSLLGPEQAHEILSLISRQVTPEEMFKRKITVGDARTFQGKERDIMLLSMVATPEDARSVTSAMFAQRFNVAASRARDRMYLFRSVEAADLNRDDLKAKLIEHFRAPFTQDPKRVADAKELCASPFERDVYDELTNRGYRVRPQVRVGAYAIDLVVEGDEDRRLAIECDGDKYHGPGRWADDMARQRVLERAGWTFWRCFASTFTLKRQAVVNELLDRLKDMGIAPASDADPDSADGRYTLHKVVDPLGVDQGSLERKADGDQVADAPKDSANSATAVPESARRVGAVEAISPPKSIACAAPLAAVPVLPVDPQPRAAVSPLQQQAERVLQGNQSFSAEAMRKFVSMHGLKSDDKRARGGALWIIGGIAEAEAIKQLKAWGFQYARSRGWWHR